MKDSAITNSSLDLTLSLGSRLCHDLISPFGAIANGIELLQMSNAQGAQQHSPEMQLIVEAVNAARARLQTFRIAFGESHDQRLSGAELTQLLRDMASNGRIEIEIDAADDHSRSDVQMLLLAVMCMENAMPWGGRLLIVHNSPSWRLVAEAERTRPEPELWALLNNDGSASKPAAAKVHFALLAQAAKQAGRTIQWDLDEAGAEIVF